MKSRKRRIDDSELEEELQGDGENPEPSAEDADGEAGAPDTEGEGSGEGEGETPEEEAMRIIAERKAKRSQSRKDASNPDNTQEQVESYKSLVAGQENIMENNALNDGELDYGGASASAAVLDFDQLMFDLNQSTEDAVVKAVAPLHNIIKSQEARIDRLTELVSEHVESAKETSEALDKAVSFLSQFGDRLEKSLTPTPVEVAPIEAASQDTTPVTQGLEVVNKGLVDLDPRIDTGANAHYERFSKAVESVQSLLKDRVATPSGGVLLSAWDGGRDVTEQFLGHVESEIEKAKSK